MTDLEIISSKLEAASSAMTRAAELLEAAGRIAHGMRELNYGAGFLENSHISRANATQVQLDAMRVRDMQRDQIAASEESDQP